MFFLVTRILATEPRSSLPTSVGGAHEGEHGDAAVLQLRLSEPGQILLLDVRGRGDADSKTGGIFKGYETAWFICFYHIHLDSY